MRSKVTTKLINQFKVTLFSVAAAVACLTTGVQAGVPLSVTQTFDALPAVADWSTLTVGGGAGTYVTAAALDTAVIANTVASAVTTVLGSSGTQPPSQNGVARWNSAGFYLQTRPTGNDYLILMATLVNDSGNNQSTLNVSYDWAQRNNIPVNEDIPGHRVYYSLTGAAASWTLIPEFSTWTTSSASSNVTAVLGLGSWAPGANLYIIWVDDNGAGSTTDPMEGAYTIDNFLAAPGGPPTAPTITSNPPPAVVVVQGRSTNLNVTATGTAPLTYQWFRGTTPVGGNSRTLSIVNAQPGVDDGDYYCHVSNAVNPPADSTHCIVTVTTDSTAPVMLRVTVDATRTNFVVSWNEDLLPSSAIDRFNYALYVQGDPGQPLLFPEQDFVLTGGTNVAITTLSPANPGANYTMQASGVYDLFGNGIPLDVPIFLDFVVPLTFRQGVDGYAGNIDTDIRQATPDVVDCAAGFIQCDTEDGAPVGPVHALMSFDVSAIPVGANINSAVLTLVSTEANANSANTESLYVMNQPWDCNSLTWNSGFGADGIQPGTECDPAPFATVTPNATVPFTMNINVAAAVQDWVNGRANYGFCMLPGGTDGYRFESSEDPIEANRPLLTITYDTTPRPPVITSVPANVSTNEGPGVSFTLTVGVSGSLVSYEWFKVVGGVTNVVAGETGNSLVRNPAVPADSGNYFLRASNVAGATNSPLISVTIGADVIAPTLLAAGSAGALTTVRLTFSETVALAGAQTPGNYTVANLCGGPNVGVSSATRVSNTIVDLTMASALSFGTSYKVTVQPGVTDLAATPNPVNPLSNSAPILQAVVLLDWNHDWRFDISRNDSNNYDGINWTAPGFDDSQPPWTNGPGIMGFDTTLALMSGAPGPFNFTLTNDFAQLEVRNEANYFRTHFNNPFSGIPVGVQVAARHYIDDALVFHLNGAESFRFNIQPAPTPITFTNRGINAGDAALQTNTVPNAQFVSGDNVIACDLHASGTTSSDIMFGIQLVATYPNAILSVQTLANGDVQLRWPCGYKLVTTDSLQPNAPPNLYTWTEVGDTDGERTITPAANQKRFYGLIP